MGKHMAKTSIVCALITFCFSAETSDLSEACIRDLVTKAVDYDVATQWMELVDEADYANIRQDLLKVAASAMLYARKMDDYKKNIKPLIANAEAFEQSLRTECPVCEGDGKQCCQHCNGSGRCQFSGCNGGHVSVQRRRSGTGFDERYSEGSRECSRCKGTGRCIYCHGDGRFGICGKCCGKGWVVTPSRVLEVYRRGVVVVREKLKAPEKLALGLDYVDGKWITPGSVTDWEYEIFQIFEPGHALCRDNNGTIFCLLYSAKDNRDVAEGYRMVNDLYRCGTYSYTTVQGAPRTVGKFAIDLEVAINELKNNRRQKLMEE